MSDPSKSTLLIRLKRSHEKDSFGTGFVYKCDSQHTWIITCAHVLEDMIPNTAKVNNKFADINKPGNSSGFDVAVLRANEDLNVPSIQLQHPSEHITKVKIYGYSKIGNKKVFRVLKATVKKRDYFIDETIEGDNRASILRVQLDEDEEENLDFGNSGSPIIDESTSRVIGIFQQAKKGGRSGTGISVEALEKSFPDAFTGLILPA